jgi:type VI protein secretion system component VasK
MIAAGQWVELCASVPGCTPLRPWLLAVDVIAVIALVLLALWSLRLAVRQPVTKQQDPAGLLDAEDQHVLDVLRRMRPLQQALRRSGQGKDATRRRQSP